MAGWDSAFPISPGCGVVVFLSNGNAAIDFPFCSKERHRAAAAMFPIESAEIIWENEVDELHLRHQPGGERREARNHPASSWLVMSLLAGSNRFRRFPTGAEKVATSIGLALRATPAL